MLCWSLFPAWDESYKHQFSNGGAMSILQCNPQIPSQTESLLWPSRALTHSLAILRIERKVTKAENIWLRLRYDHKKHLAVNMTSASKCHRYLCVSSVRVFSFACSLRQNGLVIGLHSAVPDVYLFVLHNVGY